jgi:hypothetical protein
MASLQRGCLLRCIIEQSGIISLGSFFKKLVTFDSVNDIRNSSEFIIQDQIRIRLGYVIWIWQCGAQIILGKKKGNQEKISERNRLLNLDLHSFIGQNAIPPAQIIFYEHWTTPIPIFNCSGEWCILHNQLGTNVVLCTITLIASQLYLKQNPMHQLRCPQIA